MGVQNYKTMQLDITCKPLNKTGSAYKWPLKFLLLNNFVFAKLLHWEAQWQTSRCSNYIHNVDAVPSSVVYVLKQTPVTKFYVILTYSLKWTIILYRSS